MKITTDQVVKYAQKNSITPLILSDKTKANTRYLFRALKAIYSHKFVSMYPNEQDQLVAMKIWAVKIDLYSRDELDKALLGIADTHIWVPTIAEFLSLLKLNRKDDELKQPCDYNREPIDKNKIKLNLDMIKKAFPFL